MSYVDTRNEKLHRKLPIFPAAFSRSKGVSSDFGTALKTKITSSSVLTIRLISDFENRYVG